MFIRIPGYLLIHHSVFDSKWPVKDSTGKYLWVILRCRCFIQELMSFAESKPGAFGDSCTMSDPALIGRTLPFQVTGYKSLTILTIRATNEVSSRTTHSKQ